MVSASYTGDFPKYRQAARAVCWAGHPKEVRAMKPTDFESFEKLNIFLIL